MTCRHAQSLIEDLVDGELPQARVDQLRAMLADDPGCREEYELSQKLKELLAQYTIPNPGEEYFTELQRLVLARTTESAPYGGMRSPAGGHRSVRAAFVRSIITVAASLLIFIAAVFYGSADHSVMAEKQQPAPESPTIAQAVNAGADIPLTGNSRDRVVAGVMLLGPPGFLGRFNDMALIPDLK